VRRESSDPSPDRPRAGSRKPRVEALVAIGLDGKDGHTRITRGDDFVLLGGSRETHEQMQDWTIRLTERLKERGKRIRGATLRELKDVAEDLD
jgi:hypothetical protein